MSKKEKLLCIKVLRKFQESDYHPDSYEHKNDKLNGIFYSEYNFNTTENFKKSSCYTELRNFVFKVAVARKLIKY